MARTAKIDGKAYLSMVRQGAAKLNSERNTINDLNVFPIPDGDTGDNMYMTISAGASSSAKSDSLSDVAAAVSSAMLMGARGNSGVILSRIFAGIAKGLDGYEAVGLQQFEKAMASGVKEAYNAVSTPVEGTILTVLRESVQKAEGVDFESYFDALVREMQISLDHTPDLLAVLREANVVDSGGAGMLCITEGMLESLNGVESEAGEHEIVAKPSVNLDDFGPDTELKFGYCTEFLLRLQNSKVDMDTFDVEQIREYLNAVGESVVCFRDGTIVKVHVHTMTPGVILNHVQRWGEFLTVKIENMTLQHNEATIQNNFKRKKKFGTVAVAFGSGLIDAFKQAGVDQIIEGGQTMNPSTEQFIQAFDRVGADTVFVFPNNSNVVMTARQAASMYQNSKVIVLSSKDIGSGYVAAASMDLSSGDAAEIENSAVETINSVKSGFVSKAIRDSNLDGVQVRQGDFIGISSGKIVAGNASRNALVCELADRMQLGCCDVALVFSGAAVTAEEAQQAVAAIQSKYPRTEIMLTEGNQPVYDYIIVLC